MLHTLQPIIDVQLRGHVDKTKHIYGPDQSIEYE